MNLPPWLHNLPRADFLRSVGLYVMRDHVVLVRMRKNFLHMSLVEQEARELPVAENRQAISELTGWITEDIREIALRAESDSRDRALRQAIVSLLPHFSPGRDSLYICVPQDQAAIQKIVLPQAAENNLRQVLQYEIERQLPFRGDDIYFDYLPAGKQGDKLTVYLFAIPKRNLANILDVLGSFGIRPNGVETTVTALANYLLFCKGELKHPAAIIGGQNQVWEMVGVQNSGNAWKRNAQLLFSHCLPQDDWAQGVSREIVQQCLAQSPTLFGWGEAEEFFTGAAPRGESMSYEDLLAAGNERLAGGGQIAHPHVLPALGAALRGLREASFAVNFLRQEGGVEGGEKTLSGINFILVGLLVIGALVWGASYPIKDEIRLRQVQKENQRLEPTVEALRREETQLQKARKEASFFTDLDRRKGETLRVLDELSKIVPSNAYLSNLRFRGGNLEIQGSAENASALIPLLERSPLFENVGFNAPSNRGRDNRETFSLRADVERSKVQASQP
jgi:general secretion pathway protein L